MFGNTPLGLEVLETMSLEPITNAYVVVRFMERKVERFPSAVFASDFRKDV